MTVLKFGGPRPLPTIHTMIERPQMRTMRTFAKTLSSNAASAPDPSLVLKQVAGLIGVAPDAPLGDFVDAISQLQIDAAEAVPADPASLSQRSRASGLTAHEIQVCSRMGIEPSVFAAKKAEIRAQGLSNREQRMLAEGDPKTLAARTADYADRKASAEVRKAGAR